MKTRIIHFLELISANFWMIPFFSLFVGAGLAFFNFYLDKTLYARHIEIPDLYLFFNNPENIRTLLSVSASSVLGVAGVSFSITIASLTLASQQFGPRLLRNFMLDRFNQLVLGCFIGTFLYCIFMLQFTSSMDLEQTTPFVSMVGLLILVVACLVLLVFFIHHIAVSIQADTVINAVDSELMSQMETIFPKQYEDNPQPVILEPTEDIDDKFHQLGHEIYATKSGYLQVIDKETLFEFMSEHNCAVKFEVKPGEFILQNSLIAYLLTANEGEQESLGEIEKGIHENTLIGKKGTVEQDPEFAIRQLVEVAVRALSPGINDPFTAVTCINRLARNIAFLMEREFPSDNLIDENGHLRIALKPFTFNGIVEASFNQIRQHGESDIAVTLHLLRTLLNLIKQTRTVSQAEVLSVQALAISSEQQKNKIAKKDQDDIQGLYHQIKTLLSEKQA